MLFYDRSSHMEVIPVFAQPASGNGAHENNLIWAHQTNEKDGNLRWNDKTVSLPPTSVPVKGKQGRH